MSSMARSRSAAQWYETAFGELYPLIYEHRDDESARYEIGQLARLLGVEGSARHLRVLDLCCGAGRHAEALAGRGFDVVGVDLSPELLAEAGSRDPLARRLVRCDIRDLPFGAEFDLVLNLFTSFGYFDDDGNLRAASEMARVLRPGGRLVLDHMNRDAVERGLVPEDSADRGEFHLTQRRFIEADRIRKEICVEWRGGAPEPVCLTEDVRLYRPGEMTGLLGAAGFADVALYGGFDGPELTPESGRMIAVATKAEVAP